MPEAATMVHGTRQGHSESQAKKLSGHLLHVRNYVVLRGLLEMSEGGSEMPNLLCAQQFFSPI